MSPPSKGLFISFSRFSLISNMSVNFSQFFLVVRYYHKQNFLLILRCFQLGTPARCTTYITQDDTLSACQICFSSVNFVSIVVSLCFSSTKLFFQVIHVGEDQVLQVLLDLLLSSQRFYQEPYPFKLSFEAVLAIVDVEAEGAGDGEGQVGDDADHLHPGGPRYVLHS